MSRPKTVPFRSAPFRLGLFALAVATLLLAALPIGGARAQQSARLTFVHFNDTDQMSPRGGAGGVAEATTLVRRLRAENPNTILTFGGDMFSPSLMSGFDKGAHMVALTSAMGVEVAVIGNHEFDFGPENAKARIGESKYPWLGANVVEHGHTMEGVAPSFIREVAGFKLGFLGLVTEKSKETTSAGPTIDFQPPIPVAKREAKALREKGAEIVIGMCHLDVLTELALLREVPEIDVCLSGDDHIGYVHYDGRQIALEAGQNLTHLMVLDLHVARVRSGNTERVVWRPETRLLSTAGLAPDPEIAALVKGYTAQLDASLDVRIGTAAVDIDSRRAAMRNMESNFGNLLADAMRAATKADVAITNGGGARADMLYPAGHVFSRRDILSELPFGNLTVVVRVTGRQLRQALENGVSQVASGAGRFPQVSGMAFDYDPKAPVGRRVLSVMVGAKPLDLDAAYTVATNDFMARGGDGYVVFRDAARVVDEKAARLLATTLMDHIAAAGTVAPRIEGRIVAR